MFSPNGSIDITDGETSCRDGYYHMRYALYFVRFYNLDLSLQDSEKVTGQKCDKTAEMETKSPESLAGNGECPDSHSRKSAKAP